MPSRQNALVQPYEVETVREYEEEGRDILMEGLGREERRHGVHSDQLIKRRIRCLDG
jgi:hypothetical protein